MNPGGGNEFEHNATFLPVISPQTREAIRVEYNLDYFNSPMKKGEAPGTLLDTVSESVISDVLNDEPRFLVTVFEALKKVNSYPGGSFDHYKIDAQTHGMALILRCYQQQVGPELFSNFSRLSDEDLGRVGQTIGENITRADRDTSLLEKVLSKPRIPEQQTELNALVSEVSKYESTYKDKFREGAVTMFRVLANIWPRVVPRPETPEPPTN